MNNTVQEYSTPPNKAKNSLVKWLAAAESALMDTECPYRISAACSFQPKTYPLLWELDVFRLQIFPPTPNLPMTENILLADTYI